MANKTKTRPEASRSAVARICLVYRAYDDPVTDVEKPLSQGAGVARATVNGARGLNPGLLATIATVNVSLKLTRSEIGLRESLANVSGLKSIKEFGR